MNSDNEVNSGTPREKASQTIQTIRASSCSDTPFTPQSVAKSSLLPTHNSSKEGIAMLVLEVMHKVYKLGISPLLGPRCRFFPFCSDYAMEAIRTHGIVRGLRLAIRRLSRCHPWCEGGYDPVPPRSNSASRKLV